MNEMKEGDTHRTPVLALLCLMCSWVLIVLLFAALIERWQIALSTPAARDESIPLWSRALFSLLRNAVSLPALRRTGLAVLYASPFLFIPALLTIARQSRATSILLFSALVNFLFFCMHVLVDLSVGASFEAVGVKAAVFLATYVLMLLTLSLQQLPVRKRLAGSQSL